jgi:hypothetical protein
MMGFAVYQMLGEFSGSISFPRYSVAERAAMTERN